MPAINPYLNFKGNTEEVFNFYKKVFGGEFYMVMRFGESPEADRCPAADRDKIMHISLPIGNKTMLMGTDALESMGHTLSFGNNIQIAIGTESEEEARRIFNGLSEGGKVAVPLSKAFWGALFGMFTDKYGIQWMVSYDENHLPG